ncbi:phospholipid-binding protein MlaC [Neptuniibacter sp. 2_MG-2023]|uniref:MlaC/ttg2D family ABC transporter substrate-binding protein n=1 Tax=Neptuniibacter sp. 2_MG-2023 TaxID=3062671 RepID=UPI0026E2A0A0|nr:ABC transporter substrate-binding protein [Neptuniibacter sp. 2_MG-2023]MDO6514173.1 ABC transporter substrate-binding protein [Neptuniibacter sp. 2_MG-2023]
MYYNCVSQVKTCLTIALIALLSMSVRAEIDTYNEAGGVIQTATQNVLKLLEREELVVEGQEDQLVAEIDTVLSPIVDFDYISKQVMGKYYRRASKEQRIEFSGVFKTTLLKTYAKALVGFKIDKYEMVPPRKESPDINKQIVTVDVFSADGTKYSLVYYMKKEEGAWKLVNAILDGSINIRLSFKNQFADLMERNKGDVGLVISTWKDKVDPGKDSA